jgi:hypothetical protein
MDTEDGTIFEISTNESMSERLRGVASAGLVVGAVLGMAGSFAPSVQLRGLAWGADGIAIVIASALLVVHHAREGNDQLAAGFLVLLAVTALRIFGGAGLTPLSKPLPSFAYPFLALTLVGWAWVHIRPHAVIKAPGH